MATGMGHANVVPRKLEIGMKVVVMFKPDFPFNTWEVADGIELGVWYKTELKKQTSDKWYLVTIKGQRIAFNKKDAIIIRSVSRQDNPKPWEQRNLIKVKARRQLARLAKSVKIVSSEIK